MSILNQSAQWILGKTNDRLFCELQYFRHHFAWPDLKSPKRFNEQIQWLKLFYRNPTLRQCVDKVSVREYVAQRIGWQHLIPLIAVYDRVEEVSFESLPGQFVLKASHGSGWNVICPRKDDLDVQRTRELLESWMRKDFFKVGREWAYRGLVPRLICEEFLSEAGDIPPNDYKFHCFGGEPQYIQVDYGRFSRHSRVIYDTEWRRVPCRLEYPNDVADQEPPSTLDKMLDICRKLAAEFPFVRVDLYNCRERVLFGELTFYPGKGIERFSPEGYDFTFGQWLILKDGSLVSAK